MDNCNLHNRKHKVHDSEWTTNDKGEVVFICQVCNFEIPSELLGEQDG